MSLSEWKQLETVIFSSEVTFITMRTIIEYMQLCHIHLYQKIARKKVASVNAALSHIHTGDFFACDFLIQMDVASCIYSIVVLIVIKVTLTAKNDCLKLFPFQ